MSSTSRSSRRASASTTSSECSRNSGSTTTPSRRAAIWPRIAVRGVRSSCETDIRKFRSCVSASASRSAISPKRSVKCPISPGARGQLDVVRSFGDLVGRARERQQGRDDAPREVPAEYARHEQPERAREREALDQSQHAITHVGLLLGDDDRADRPVLSQVNGMCDRQIRRMEAGRDELERQRLAGCPVDRLQVQLPKARRLAREQRHAVVVDPVAGGELEVRAGERWRAPRVLAERRVEGRGDGVRVEPRDPVRFAPKLVDRLVVGERPEELHCDRRGDKSGHQHPADEDERQTDAEGREHSPSPS